MRRRCIGGGITSRLVIHPLFFVAALIYLILGQFAVVLACFASVIFHELAHAAMARRRGVVFDEIVLMPYGAALKGADFTMLGKRGAAVALAGPAFSFAVFVGLSSLWWFFPATYLFTQELAFINLTIALFNLLPVPPLDGSKLVLIYAKRKVRAMKFMRAIGVILSVLLLVSGIFLAYTTAFNMSIFVIAIFLFYGSVSAGTDEALAYTAAAALCKNNMLNVRLNN